MKKLFFPLFLILLLLQILSCGRKDYSVVTSWFYINETDSVITFSKLPNEGPSINPKDTLFFFNDSEGPKEPDPVRMIAIVELPAEIVFYGNGFCDTQATSDFNINNINNYEIKTITKQNFEYTYRFTKEMLEKAKPCD
jgi:hypothetical protein